MIVHDMTTGPATSQDISKLAVLIRRDSEQLLTRWRQQVKQLPSAKHLDVPTINDHIPELLRDLANAFDVRSDATMADALQDGTPPAHGVQRVEDGFDIAEVVAEYNILRDCIYELAEGNGLILQGKSFHILNSVFDRAIGLAVQSFADERASELQRRRQEYLAFVAHDLRTPLNAIALAADVLEMLQPPEGGEGEGMDMVTTLHRNVRSLKVMVEKILEESAHLTSENGVNVVRRSFDLWPLVGSTMHALKPLAITNGTVLLNKVPVELVVFADAGLLRRILQNLIGNAIAYTRGGEVRIGAEATADGTVVCWVSDTGAGIPADKLPNVFAKGEGDAAKEESSGLGLAIVKSFIEAHGGTVAIESEVGKGSTIRFMLPQNSTD